MLAQVFLPHGYLGIWAAVPFAIWFFLAVEGVPLAAEEAKDPAKSLPRGLIGAMLILTAFAMLILFLGAGAAGASTLQNSGAPSSMLWLKCMAPILGLRLLLTLLV